MSEVWIENKQYIDSLYADLDKRMKINWTYMKTALTKMSDMEKQYNSKIEELTNEIKELKTEIKKPWYKKIF